ncbi:MAG TPA: ankyrin repeat domain-containing protein [Tepidisphaeraceae bacterium]|jgi:hypothetical protein
MTKRSSVKRSHHHLKHLVEETVSERFNLGRRGLAFFVDEVEVHGSPPERLRVWASLHFLPNGSPFCCCEPCCHVPQHPPFGDEIGDAIRRRLGLQSAVVVEFAAIRPVVQELVEFDDVLGGDTPIGNAADIDQRDPLGRTALMRAAARGYDHQVEQLLATGADPSVVDHRGRGVLEQARPGWISTMIEQALAKRTAYPRPI